jgi:hypothetical protein
MALLANITNTRTRVFDSNGHNQGYFAQTLLYTFIMTKATVTASSSSSTAKFLRPGKVVILLSGRHAGKKAFIVNPYEGQGKEYNTYI